MDSPTTSSASNPERICIGQLAPPAFEVVDSPFAPESNYSAIPLLVDALADLPDGKYMKLAEALSQADEEYLRQVAVRRGVLASIRHIGSETYIGKRSRPRRTVLSPRNRGIIDAFEAGQTYEAIGRAHSLSRQRIEQIVKSNFVRGVRPDQREAAVDSFMAPYLATRQGRPCLVCAKDVPTRKARLCATCDEIVRCTERVRALLNCYRRDPSARQALRQAAYEIRKYHIKPEHLGFPSQPAAQGGS